MENETVGTDSGEKSEHVVEIVEKNAPDAPQLSRAEILKKARAAKASKRKKRHIEEVNSNADDSSDSELTIEHPTYTIKESTREPLTQSSPSPQPDFETIINDLQATVNRIERVQKENASLEQLMDRLRELERTVIQDRTELTLRSSKRDLQKIQEPAPLRSSIKKQRTGFWAPLKF